jgi:hypothetical protein
MKLERREYAAKQLDLLNNKYAKLCHWETDPLPKVQVTHAPVPHLIDFIGRGGAI